MPAADFLAASLPLFEAGEVDVVEWSFDTAWTDHDLPSWMPDLLDDFAASHQLLGHGVSYSALSARWEPRQEDWLARLREAFARRSYVRLSEHFGFMTAEGFAFGAPMPVPFTDAALRVGRDRLRRLADAARVDVGLENLAFALGEADVREQGPFLDALLEVVDGFLVLDLHNVHCQAENFGLDPRAILTTYPLARVREIHVSGGSWSGEGATRVRQDTHDGPLPDPVLDLVPWVMNRCPRLEHVIFERLGGTIVTVEDQARFGADFRRLRAATGAAPAG
jgi:uncharacterized protein (UPF0276 family)